MSGVLAAVVSGLYSGWHAPSAFDAETRLAGTAFWRVLTFGLETTLFVLLGLQAPVLAEELEIAPLAAQAVVVALVVVGVRMAWALLPPVGAGDTVRERIAVGWSGMRGAISLAAALAVTGDRGRAPGDPPHHVRRDRRHPARAGPHAPARPAPPAAPGREPVVAGRGAWCASRRRRRRSTGWRSSRAPARPRSRSSGCATSTARASPSAWRRSGGTAEEPGGPLVRRYGDMRRDAHRRRAPDAPGAADGERGRPRRAAARGARPRPRGSAPAAADR